MTDRLQGKTAIVTGAASGIGLAIAELFIAEGANVVVGDIQDEKGKSLEQQFDGALTYKHTDVLREDDIESLVGTAVERYGALDIMVNNAGASSQQTIVDLDADKFDRQIALLLRAVVLGHKHAARQFVAQGTGGSIITTASIAGLQGGWADVAYTSAKHGLQGVIRSATAELAPQGIRSNAIAPGITMAPAMSAMFAPAGENTDEWISFLSTRFKDAQPIRSAGLPEFQAQAALFFADEKASGWISGVVLPVDGGTTAVYQGPFHAIGPKAAEDWLAGHRD